jgi:hypothetical protein
MRLPVHINFIHGCLHFFARLFGFAPAQRDLIALEQHVRIQIGELFQVFQRNQSLVVQGFNGLVGVSGNLGCQ